MPSALGMRSRNHWTVREAPSLHGCSVCQPDPALSLPPALLHSPLWSGPRDPSKQTAKPGVVSEVLTQVERGQLVLPAQRVFCCPVRRLLSLESVGTSHSYQRQDLVSRVSILVGHSLRHTTWSLTAVGVSLFPRNPNPNSFIPPVDFKVLPGTISSWGLRL